MSILSCISDEFMLGPSHNDSAHMSLPCSNYEKELVDGYGLVNELFHEQSGHKKQVRGKYTLDFLSIQNLSTELQNFTI
jgi:hypothetical protein